MSLQRQAILERVRDILLGKTDAEQAVYIAKAEPDQGHELPIISIYGASETRGEFVEVSPVRFVRVLKVAVEIKVSNPETDNASLRMNLIAEQVERIVLRDPMLRGADKRIPLAKEVRFLSMDLVIDSASNQVIVGLTDLFEVDYVYEPEEEAPAQVRAFLTAHVDYPMAGDLNDTADDVALEGS